MTTQRMDTILHSYLTDRRDTCITHVREQLVALGSPFASFANEELSREVDAVFTAFLDELTHPDGDIFATRLTENLSTNLRYGTSLEKALQTIAIYRKCLFQILLSAVQEDIAPAANALNHLIEVSDRATTLTSYHYQETLSERQATIETLREETFLFKGLADSLQYGVGISTMDGSLIYTNAAYEQMTGTSRGMRIADSPSETYAETFQEIIPTLIHQGRYSQVITMHRGEQNSSWTANIDSAMLLDTSSTPTAIITTIQDITHQRVQEQKWHTFEMLADYYPDSVCITSLEGMNVYINHAFEKTLGYEEQSIGMKIQSLVIPEERERFLNMIQQLHNTDTWQGIVIFQRKDGRTFPAHTEVFLIRDLSNVPKGVGFIIHDMSKERYDVDPLHKHDQLVQITHERMFFAFQATEDGIWDWNLVSNNIYCSPQWFTMLGYDPGDIEITRETWIEIIHPGDQEFVLRTLSDHLESRTPVYETTYRVRTKNGSWKWILTRGKVVARSEMGKPLRIIGTHIDLSNRLNTLRKR